VTKDTTPQRFHLWLAVYNESMQPIAADLCNEIFELLDRHFELGRATYASYGSQPRTPIKDPRQWLHEHAKQLEAQSRSQPMSTGQASMWKPRERCPTWGLVAMWSQLTRVEGVSSRDPSLIVGVDLAIARSADAIRAYAYEATALLLRRPETWYGLLNPGMIPYVGRDSFYRDADATMRRWEPFVEQCYWHKHALATRDRVRGIYWGNIFGSDFSRKIVEAGYLRRAEVAVENWPEAPVTLTEAATGAMAVFLDNDPARFARQRETGFDLDTMSGAVMSAGMLKDVLSRAQML
jgi:hypothetical protein